MATTNGRFNRTFMELKDLRANLAIDVGTFQSHLYGIERQNQHEVEDGRLVSIAPLWN